MAVEHQRPPPVKPQELSRNLTRIVSGVGKDENNTTIDNIPFHETGLWGATTALLWRTSETPSKDSNTGKELDGAHRPGDRFGGFVNSNGTNFIVQDLAPGAEVPMHRSNSIDYIIMIKGEVISTGPGEKEEFHIKEGDILVRKANTHGYQNPGPGWARYAVVILDAEPVVVGGEVVPETLPNFDSSTA
ncbi:Oryzines biosynthesis cluster protein J [Psilocybe cubensis]|uniref:Oryzines biosynthesis cluster protein J n=2 Tax=Psilocybe cubensis TaxID=181762 RepID=A0ACB8GK94_PSICU|nr:Oryzines biosynthesis cluster protein J [Psilocybe cubensis]KAH9475875.1 Oryzines biosynthesis cluster protein J [Psilocybe cubensis]